MSPAYRIILETKLRAHEERTGRQVALLTLDSLEGEPLEGFSLKVARAWGLGSAERNDGVLFLISKNDRKMRIEVGHGLEGNLPDALAGRIIADVVAPRFKGAAFEEGITLGLDAILSAADGNYAPPPPRRGGRAPTTTDRLMRMITTAVLLAFLGVTTLFGVAAGRVGWLVFLFTLPLCQHLPPLSWSSTARDLCFAGYIVFFCILKYVFRNSPKLKPIRAMTAVDAHDFSSSGGSWSGGSSGGSGFSGGGGSFGGGGASGSW